MTLPKEARDRSDALSSTSLTSTQLQWIYLIGYLLAAAANNVPSAYRYILLDSHGISRSTIEMLFVIAYGSSLLVGTFVASLADRFGRRLACLLCGVLYGLSYISYNFRDIWILIVGLSFWGVANAYYNSGFEAWLIQEHHERHFDTESLKHTLRNSFVGLTMISMATGLFAELLAESFGYTAPFDVGIAFFVLMSIFILWKWPENYGGKSTPVRTSLRSAVHVLWSDPRIIILGLSTALFNASLYIFVIEWTPTLQAAKQMTISHSLPLGYIFTGYMFFRMIGTLLFGPLVKHFRPQTFMIVIFFIAAIGYSVPIILPNTQLAILIGFFLIEMCDGVFLPSMALLRSHYFPNEIRATVMNYVRVPELLLIITILLAHFRLSVLFIVCVSMLIMAMFCMILLRKCLKMPEDEAHLDETQQLISEQPSPLFKITKPPMQSSDTLSLVPQTSLASEKN